MGSTDLQELKKRYLDIAETDPNFLPDKNIEAKIGRLDKIQIGDMDIGHVHELVETLLEVEHEIKTHDKLINDAKNRAVAETAAQSVREIRKAWGKGKNPLRWLLPLIIELASHIHK